MNGENEVWDIYIYVSVLSNIYFYVFTLTVYGHRSFYTRKRSTF